MATTEATRVAISESTAAGWDKWDEWNRTQMRPVFDWLVAAARPAPGQIALDLATGPGNPALAVAERVGPRGRVIATDLSPEMVATATRRARAAGLDQVEVRLMAQEAIDLPDRSCDLVTCGFGIMFSPDPADVARRVRQVLRPGGRFALAVWAVPARNPFFTTVFGALGRVVPTPPQDPRAPGMFRLGPPGELEAVLQAGGFERFERETLALTMEMESVDRAFEMFCDMAPPLKAARSALSAAEFARVREAYGEALTPYLVGGRVRVPAEAIGAWAAA